MINESEDIIKWPAVALYLLVCVLFGGIFGCWLRVMDAIAGRTLFTLGVYGGTAVAGALGGAAAAFIGGRKKAVSAAFFCTVLLAAAGFHVFLMRAVAGLGASWQQLLLDATRNFHQYARLLGKSCIIMALFFGVLAGAAAMRTLTSVRSARFFSWSVPGVLGFLAGSWFFAAFLTSIAGIRLPLRLLPVLLVLAAAAVICTGDRLQRLSSLALVLAAFGSLFYTGRLNLEMILSRGTFGRVVHRDSGFAFGDPVEQHQTLRHTVALYEDRDYRFVFELDNRPVMFGNRFHTSRILNAYVPLLVNPGSGRVLLAGSEAGLFAPYYLNAGVADLRYYGADREVTRLAMRQAPGRGVQDDSAFDRLRKGDFSDRYDLIVLTPEPVFMRGAARFYSRGMLDRAARALREGGAVALHLDARSLSREAFASVLAGMRAVFPHMQVWCTGVHEWMLVGSPQPVRMEAEGILRLFERDEVFRDFVRAGKISAADVLACLVCDAAGVERWLAESGDGISLFEIAWKAPGNVLEGGKVLMSPVYFEKVREISSAEWLQAGEVDNGVYDALVAMVDRNISARLSAVMAVASMTAGKIEEGLQYAREAAAVNPNDAFLVQFSEALELEGRRRMSIGDYKGAVRCYENMLSFNRESPQAHYGMGLCLRANGDIQNAYIHFARAVVGAPSQTHYRLEFAEVALSAGQFETADKQYQKILEQDPENARVMLLYARALVYKGREDRQADKAVEMARKACEITGWQIPEVIIGLADMYIEAGRVMEGMGLKRRLKEGGIEPLKGEG